MLYSFVYYKYFVTKFQHNFLNINLVVIQRRHDGDEFKSQLFRTTMFLSLVKGVFTKFQFKITISKITRVYHHIYICLLFLAGTFNVRGLVHPQDIF